MMLFKGIGPSFAAAPALRPAAAASTDFVGRSAGGPGLGAAADGRGCSLGFAVAIAGCACLASSTGIRRSRGLRKVSCKAEDGIFPLVDLSDIQSSDARSSTNIPPAPHRAAVFSEKVCAAATFVSSAKSSCVHPDRKDPYLCGDCPRNGKAAGLPSVDMCQEGLNIGNLPGGFAAVCAAASFVSSAKSSCVHPDRKPPNLCGDCPRNDKACGLPPVDLHQEGVPPAGMDATPFAAVCAAAAFVSSAKSSCVHPDRKDPYLCGDCPRNAKMGGLPPLDLCQEQP